MNRNQLKVILEVLIHFFLTLTISLIIYLKSNNLIYVLVFILGGIFIDLDHFIDWFIFAKNKFNLKDFLDRKYIKSGKIYLFFHSWELNLILFLLGIYIKSQLIAIFSLSLSIHLAIDNLQRKNLLFYFLSYRMIKRFDAKILLPEFSYP
jgi:hypothetical protein